MLMPLFVRHKSTWKRIELEDVVRLETEGNYTQLFVANNTFYLARLTMAKALKKLPPELFVRTDRSNAVSIYHIVAVHKESRELLMSDKSKVPIARYLYKDVIRQLNIFE